jgi:hypothetical protein
MELKLVDLGQQPPASREVPWGLVSNALLFARLTEATTHKSSWKLLDELDRALTIYFPEVTGRSRAGDYKKATWCDTYEEDYTRPAPWYDNFMSLNVRFGLKLYVQDTIRKKGQRCLVKPGRPLLDYACRPEPKYEHWSAYIDPDLVQILLLNGADPNLKFNGFSAWQNCLYTETEDPIKWISLLKLLIIHEADLKARIELRRNNWETALEVIQRCFGGFINGNANATELMMSRFELRGAEVKTENVPAETLAQLKLDVIELKGLIINGVPKDVHGKARNRGSRIYGERVVLLVKHLLGRGRKQ